MTESCYGDSVTESCYGDSVTETPTHFNPYRFRQTLSTTHRRLIPCKGYLNTHQTQLPAKFRSQPPRFRSALSFFKFIRSPKNTVDWHREAQHIFLGTRIRFLAMGTSTHTKLSSLPSLVLNLHDFGQLYHF